MSDSESDSDYSEENLDDFMIKASSVLSEENHPDKVTMVESLKQHLASIFHDQTEMENFFKTLNSIIFSSKSKKNDQKKISNKQPFKLYPLIFAFNPKSSFFYVDYFLTSLQLCAFEENREDFPYLSTIFAEVIVSFFSEKNKHLIKKNTLLDQNKKIKLYEKFLNFCNNNIKTNKKAEQSFGCSLLTEFLEKCPLAKEEKNLDNLVNIISEYLDDRWFECKLDLLNCTISLIFTGGKNFKPYAETILYKILDYLSDEEWMKRKLAINIIFTLIFYCKEEMLAVKDNFIDFLTALKDDPVNEVKEKCLQTLDFIEESDPNKVEDEEENKEEEQDNKSTSKKNKNNKNKPAQKKKVGKSDNLTKKIKKEKEMLEKLEKEYNAKRNKYKKYKKGENVEMPEEDEVITDNNDKSEIKQNQHDKELNDKINSALYNILQQIKKIKEEQNELYNIYEEVKQTIDNNYSSLNQRLKIIENKSSKYSK